MLHHARNLTLITMVTLVAGSATAQKTPWAPPSPSALDRDWIRLSSGEWLWGDIDLLRDESLDFDSEELDNVTIDWVDVVEIRSARVLTYVMINGVMVTGTSALKGDTLKVNTSEGEIEISRQRVSSILEGKPTELNFWSAKVGADLKMRSGNTDQQDLGIRISLKREAARSKIDLRFVGNFSKVDSIKTVDNRRINAEWKIFLSRFFFVTPARGEAFTDKFQNIDLRTTVGAGLGYYFSRTSKTDWFVDLGTSYQNTEYRSVLPGEEDSDSIMSLPLRTTLEIELSSTIDLTAEYGVQLGLGHEANTIHNTFILFEFDLIGDIDFNASLTWDHISRPKTNSEGITPKKDDLAMAYGLSVDF